MKIRIKVTKELLKRAMLCGTSCDPDTRAKKDGKGSNCVVALAVQEIIPTAHVGMVSIYANSRASKSDFLCHLPRTASDFIKKFDDYHLEPERRLLMPEFDFEIDLPETAFDGVNLSEVYRILSESKTLELAENFESV